MLALWGVVVSVSPNTAVAQRVTDCGYYAYSRGVSEGRHCAGAAQEAPTRPVTAICRDGSYSFDSGRDACWFRGGVQLWKH